MYFYFVESKNRVSSLLSIYDVLSGMDEYFGEKDILISYLVRFILLLNKPCKQKNIEYYAYHLKFCLENIIEFISKANIDGIYNSILLSLNETSELIKRRIAKTVETNEIFSNSNYLVIPEPELYFRFGSVIYFSKFDKIINNFLNPSKFDKNLCKFIIISGMSFSVYSFSVGISIFTLSTIATGGLFAAATVGLCLLYLILNYPIKRFFSNLNNFFNKNEKPWGMSFIFEKRASFVEDLLKRSSKIAYFFNESLSKELLNQNKILSSKVFSLSAMKTKRESLNDKIEAKGDFNESETRKVNFKKFSPPGSIASMLIDWLPRSGSISPDSVNSFKDVDLLEDEKLTNRS